MQKAFIVVRTFIISTNKWRCYQEGRWVNKGSTVSVSFWNTSQAVVLLLSHWLTMFLASFCCCLLSSFYKDVYTLCKVFTELEIGTKRPFKRSKKKIKFIYCTEYCVFLTAVFMCGVKMRTVRCNEFQPRCIASQHRAKATVRSIRESDKTNKRGYILLVCVRWYCCEKCNCTHGIWHHTAQHSILNCIW